MLDDCGDDDETIELTLYYVHPGILNPFIIYTSGSQLVVVV